MYTKKFITLDREGMFKEIEAVQSISTKIITDSTMRPTYISNQGEWMTATDFSMMGGRLSVIEAQHLDTEKHEWSYKDVCEKHNKEMSVYSTLTAVGAYRYTLDKVEIPYKDIKKIDDEIVEHAKKGEYTLRVNFSEDVSHDDRRFILYHYKRNGFSVMKGEGFSFMWVTW